MIDITKIKQNSQKEIIHPVKIFASLPNKNSKYNGYLRDVQSEVLNKWFEQRENKENIIKMNTGSGKTTVSLLILQSCLNEKKGNAIYVVPDKYLIEQVKKEAADLGINVTDNPEDIDYMRNKAILIISIQKLINGKSIFMRKNIDNILIDDVHACLEIASSQFKISISKSNFPKLYNDILNLFKSDLEPQNYHNFINIVNSNPTSESMLVPFWAVQEKYKEVLKLITSNNSNIDYKDIEFPLGLIGDILDICNIVVSFDHIEITPDCLPIHKISNFDNAKRRIYVSATLKDDGTLVKNFNINIDNIKEIITPEYALDIGDRIILYPQINNPKITDDEIKKYLKEKSKDLRIIVIVPSKKRAEFWKDVADRIFNKDNINEIKKYTTGLDILINRYNGIDLKDELCRILVIDGLPNAITKYDEIKEMRLLTTNQSIKEQMQKIEQGMGRGIRSNQDYCGIILMGKNLSNIIYQGGATNNFSKSTLKQFELSEEFYEDLKNKNIEDILENLEYCIGRHPDWVTMMKETISDVKYENKINYDRKEILEYNAYQDALKKDYTNACDKLQLLVNEETNQRLKGYYMMILAKYKNFYDKENAQNILASAKKYNRNVLIPMQGYSHKKLNKKIENQAKQLLEYIQNNYESEKDYFFKINSIVDNLSFVSGTHYKFEAAINDLANNIGFIGSMPEKEVGNGPDNLWNISHSNYLVIECKNEAISNFVSKEDCGQLHNSYNWVKEQYGEECNYTGIIIHKSSLFDKKATPNKNFLIFSEENIEKLKTQLREYASEIANIKKENLTVDKLKSILEIYKFDSNSFIEEYIKKSSLK